MIGDSATDIRTARAAGIPVIAVDFGYSERPVSELRPGPHNQPFCAIAGSHSRNFACKLMRLATVMVNAVRLTGCDRLHQDRNRILTKGERFLSLERTG